MKTFILCLCLISITIAALVILRLSLSMLAWHSVSEEIPTEEKQYLCRVYYDNKSYFKVLWWTNNLSKIDKFGPSDCGGFYKWDPEIGYHEDFCDYWQEINWHEED